MNVQGVSKVKQSLREIIARYYRNINLHIDVMHANIAHKIMIRKKRI